MVGNKVVRCSKCGEELFYIPDSYKMAVKVVCVKCGEKKTRARRKKSPRTTAASNYARVKGGVRKDVHPIYYFRSPTEANFARILQYHNIEYKFEERAFTFEGYKTKPHVYVMDFEILSKPRRHKKEAPEELTMGFYEIKGYMNPASRNKLRRLKKQYPEEFKTTCVVVYDKYKKKDIEFCEKLGYRYMIYKEMEKEYKDKIPTWE